MRAIWNFLKAFWLPVSMGVVIILGFAVWVQLSKETNWFANWLFTFLKEWATVLSAAVTLLLAFAALWVISDTRHFRDMDSKIRSLNDICSWALDAKRALFVPWFNHQWAAQSNMREELEHIAARSVFVKSDAKRLCESLAKGKASEPSARLAQKVNEAATNLDQFINSLKVTAVRDFGGLEPSWENFDNDFKAVIESASDITIPPV